MWVLIQGPTRQLRQRIDTTVSEHQAKLMPGYAIIGTISLCDHEGNGGFVSPLNGPSLMGELLKAHGDELLAWLKQQAVMFGVTGSNGPEVLYAKSEDPLHLDA